MDAAEYLRIRSRMTKNCQIECKDCPFSETNNGTSFEGYHLDCDNLEVIKPEKAVEIIEQWAKDHPSNTLQDELLKLIPTVDNSKGYLDVCPLNLDRNYNCNAYDNCRDCKKDYWLQEYKGEE